MLSKIIGVGKRHIAFSAFVRNAVCSLQREHAAEHYALPLIR